MKRVAVIALLLVSATCARTASASAPSGFTENAKLDARATYIAGKPVQVFCAQSYAVWSAYVETLSTPPPNGEANGATPLGGTETYLSSDACAPILARLRGRTPSLLALGATLDVLTHEAIHLRGESDEGQTECDAIRTLPAYLVAKWGFRKNSSAYFSVLRGARNYHNSLPPQYRTVC